MIILDTNVISEPLRPAPDHAVLEWLDRQAVGTLYLTTVTIAEMRHGIANLPAGRRRKVLASRLDAEVLPHFAGRILDFDLAAAEAYGELRGCAKRAGKAVGPLDGMIAAIALVHGFTVATRDAAPFRAAGVRVVDPFA